MYYFFILILAGYLICLAYCGYRAAIRLQGAEITPQERIGRYRISIRWNVLSALAVTFVAAVTPVTLYDLGFRTIHFSNDSTDRMIRIGSFLTAGCLTILFLYQILAFLLSSNFRQEQVKTLRKRKEIGRWYDRVVDNLIPRSRQEKCWFAFSALAAGISEEIVFRGFALLLLEAVFPSVSHYGLAAVTGFLFGLAHYYQGICGVVKTALLGTLFGFLYLGTDSLIPCIFLHTLFDLSSAFLYESDCRSENLSR